MKTSTLLSSLTSGLLVSGHGFVQQIWLGDNLVDTWDPYKDPQKDPPVDKITRKFKDNGPVTDGLFTVCITVIITLKVAVWLRYRIDRRSHLQHRHRWNKQRSCHCYR